VLIPYDTLPKMKKLLGIVGGRVILEEHLKDHVRMIVEKP